MSGNINNRTVAPVANGDDSGEPCGVCRERPHTTDFGPSVRFAHPARLICNVCVTRLKGSPDPRPVGGYLDNRGILPTFHENDATLGGANCWVCQFRVGHAANGPGGPGTAVEFLSPQRIICGVCVATIETATP